MFKPFVQKVFAGIGTAGGSIVPDQGFTVLGIRRPMNVTKGQLADPLFHANFYVDQNVATTTTTTITFTNPIDTEALLPYSLKAGTAIWVRNINTGVESSAILAATPLSGDKRTINVEAANNGINTVSVGEIGLPYIRRFIDPRKPIDQSYSLWLTNSSSKHRGSRKRRHSTLCRNTGSRKRGAYCHRLKEWQPK